jgi:preprotein translocase SecF subunit
MLRLFHDNNIDFLGHKAVFMTISVVLMLIGCVGVVARGFNLGVDFAGGSLYYVQFVKAPDTEQIRAALRELGFYTQLVMVQPISACGRTAGGQGLLNRLPLEAGGGAPADAGGIGNQKRVVLRALNTFNADQTGAASKSDLNTADETEIANEVRTSGAQIDPAANVDQLAQAIVAYRNSQPQGIFTSVDQVRQTPNLPPTVADAVASTFYVGKTDINSIGGDDFLNLMKRLDPLGLAGDAAAADEQYKKLRDDFITYRDKTKGGVVGSLDELPFGDYPQQVRDAINQHFFVGAFNVTNAEAVGAAVGADLRNRAIYVTLASLVGMLVFIAFRFEWIYGVSAVLAVFHDVPVCLGIFALFGWEVNLTVVAAILTLIGYSTNDTIVIFDRIRETLRMHRRDPIEKVTNDAINQTLSRTVIASGTAFLTVLVLTLFGGDVLRSFALVLLIGIVVGTYSSIGIASPIMIWWQRRQQARRALLSPARAKGGPAVPEQAGTRGVRTAKTI